MKTIFYTALFFVFTQFTVAQNDFNYSLEINPITINGLPGLHSFSFGQDNGKWLIIGGRLDGLHARQPFNAFPASNNNTTIFVVDKSTQQSWSVSLSTLPVGIREQLQSTNMNFYQDGSTLYIIGGYAFSTTANDHITFDKLTAIDVPGLINAIINNTPVTPFFKQTTHSLFAVTGGQLGKIDNVFYLIGGHRFDGRYNPMGNPTFTQNYSNQIRKFTIDNSGSQLSFSLIEQITDPIHLHRRDYNLVPQVFPDGELGYTISSGVFQINQDLPFLYPVDIKAEGHFPQTGFNQYLSNYHSGKVGLYEVNANNMHSLFFGGMSQYYYNGTTLVQDNLVPFVKTISRVTRNENGVLSEHQFPVEMPLLSGAGAEFIQNLDLPHCTNEVIKLDDIDEEEFVIGHLVGGIHSNSLNPFSANQTSTTSASPTVYEIKLTRQEDLSIAVNQNTNPFSVKIAPNPIKGKKINVEFYIPYHGDVAYFITSLDGKMVSEGEIVDFEVGSNKFDFQLNQKMSETFIITFVFDNKFYNSQKIVVQ
ncbi:hypothetical protein [Flavobacterium lacus]|uniref:Galactose oxidase-like protein n=1 Tax=Flavobacterium lacus TaxID=1353778 RepID=A0A328WP47_9FLAO|nr:hypothetical protein [Flavobacterium lacus]RAR46926.1 hypothetical protein B0I10_11342 [Flavobacterium lacus]